MRAERMELKAMVVVPNLGREPAFVPGARRRGRHPRGRRWPVRRCRVLGPTDVLWGQSPLVQLAEPLNPGEAPGNTGNQVYTFK